MGTQARTRLLTAGVLLTVFGAGLLFGLAVDEAANATPAAALVLPAADSDDGDGDEQAGENRRMPMYEQVGPDAAQSVILDSIVVEHRARLDALNREFQERYDPQFRAIVEETREAIKGVFTPEQAARYQELLDARDRERAAEQGSGGSDEDDDRR
jgi:Spy/CpxP family protein refolding chaperone